LPFQNSPTFTLSIRVFPVDIDHQVANLFDQFFKVFGVNLGEVNGDALLVHRQVH